jgi:hypothetical protein
LALIVRRELDIDDVLSKTQTATITALAETNSPFFVQPTAG